VTLAEIGERALITRVRDRATQAAGASAPDWVLTGIGDDAAVLKPARGMVDVMTTDALVEDVHFRRAWSTPRDIGRKALAVNLSDLAAMGASPRALLLSMALPASLPLDDFDGLLDGFLSLAAQVRTPLVGGNLTRSPAAMVLNVTAVGSARTRRLLRRSGALPGDRLFVTGRLGGAAAGLLLRERGVTSTLTDEERTCVQRYDSPEARLRTGIVVARNRAASVCMDLSDGLADAVAQLTEASGCGADLEAAAIPVQSGADLGQALSGGEDYELLFAVPKRRTRLFLAAVTQAGEAPAAEIGVCTKALGTWLIGEQGRIGLGEGFGHFK
jgi:thiamine-monophosphate kinase